MHRSPLLSSGRRCPASGLRRTAAWTLAVFATVFSSVGCRQARFVADNPQAALQLYRRAMGDTSNLPPLCAEVRRGNGVVLMYPQPGAFVAWWVRQTPDGWVTMAETGDSELHRSGIAIGFLQPAGSDTMTVGRDLTGAGDTVQLHMDARIVKEPIQNAGCFVGPLGPPASPVEILSHGVTVAEVRPH